MQWGYALVWAGQFTRGETEPWVGKLNFLTRYGMTSTGCGLGEVDTWEPAYRDRIFGMLADKGLGLTAIPSGDYMNPDIAIAKAAVATNAALLRKHARGMRAPIAHFGVAGPYNRYLASPTLAEQMDRLSTILPPLFDAAADVGIPLAMENHGDYFVADLVGLAKRLPALKIFLDTGNVFLVGEGATSAYELAAPLVVGGHFKDHVLRPVASEGPLRLEIGAATLGTGHVPLRECHAILKARTPKFANLTMQIELIPPSFKGDDPIASFEQSWAFCKSLGQ